MNWQTVALVAGHGILGAVIAAGAALSVLDKLPDTLTLLKLSGIILTAGAVAVKTYLSIPNGKL